MLAARFLDKHSFSRRRWLALASGCLLLGCMSAESTAQIVATPTTVTPSTPLEVRVRQLHALFQDYWQDKLKHEPELASAIGDHSFDDQLSDYSVDAYNDKIARGFRFLSRLSNIDTAGMSEQDQLSKRLLVHDLIDQQEEASCKPWQTPVTQLNGLPVDLPSLVAVLPFNNVDDYQHYIARLQAVSQAFNQISDDMQLGIEQHNTEPQYLMKKVLLQVNAIAAQKPAASVFAGPLRRFPTNISVRQQAEIRDQVLSTIQMQVLPAYTHFAKFLSAIYIPAARTEPGEWATPNGDACYAYAVRHYTTTNMTPDQIHALGLAQIAAIQPQLIALVHSLGFADLKSFRASLAANPKEHAQSEQQLLRLYRSYEAQMEAKLPSMFNRLPVEKLVVVPMDAVGASDQVPADYQPGTPNGSRPGWLRVDTSDVKHRLLTPVEAIAYHEGVPGHHLQISLAQENKSLPDFRRYEDYTAFVEGWALYSEQLGKEAGFYTDPYSEYGRLDNEMWRAVRLVVDTGIHSQHWTRDQAVQYFHDHCDLDDVTVQEEIDRYIAWPGQALAYKVGELEILKMRAAAQQSLGTRFDLRAFHDEVLSAGALPLDIFDGRMESWIAAQKAVAPLPVSQPQATTH